MSFFIIYLNLDCQDGSDEANCSFTECKQEEFRCRNGRCINNIWKCGKFECYSGSIEISFKNIFHFQMVRTIAKMVLTNRIATKRHQSPVKQTNSHVNRLINAFHHLGSVITNM